MSESHSGETAEICAIYMQERPCDGYKQKDGHSKTWGKANTMESTRESCTFYLNIFKG